METRERCEICSKLIHSGVITVNFEHTLHNIVLGFPLLILSK